MLAFPELLSLSMGALFIHYVHMYTQRYVAHRTYNLHKWDRREPRFFYLKVAFGDIDFKLLIKKEKTPKEPLTLSTCLAKEI